MTAMPVGPPPDGPFETFHPSGEVLTRGRYLRGKYDGIVSRFTSKAPGSEPLRACCVPPGAIELRCEYAEGSLLSETFFDAEGRPLCADGTPWPERPSGVPLSADFDEGSGRYVLREGGLFAPTRLRYFNHSGLPEEEIECEAARTTLRRSFGPDGRVVEEWGLDAGKPHGAYLLRFDAAHAPYLDARIREERGSYEQGECSSSVHFLDEHGAALRTAERGAPLPGGTSDVVSGERPGDTSETAEALHAYAERLVGEGRMREAFSVAARALARDRDTESFRRLLAREVVALQPALAAERARRAAEGKARTPSRVLGELLAGAEPAAALRTLASSIAASYPAALDYAEAACLLAPAEGVNRATRGLLRLEHGDRDGALEDARAIAPHSAAAAEFLEQSARALFPEFGFEPLSDPVAASDEELPPCTTEQPLEAVRRTVGLYATRIALVRDELLRRLPSAPAWLPPDTRALLPSGPVELGRYVAKISDEDEAGNAEISEVPVDETLELADRSVRGLMTLARADWAALAWLCWSVGLDNVALPEQIEPRELFAAAANRATVRCFWAHDRLRTEGLGALSRKVPPFHWQGIPIQTMPRHLCEIAAAEYLEVRAAFFWLLFPANVSPFQADLRKA